MILRLATSSSFSLERKKPIISPMHIRRCRIIRVYLYVEIMHSVWTYFN